MSKALIFVSFFLTLGLLFPSLAKAQFETPENINITLSGLAVVNNTLVTKLEIDNPSDKTLSNVYYSAALTMSGQTTNQIINGQQYTATASGQLINYSDSKPFNIDPASKTQQEIKIPFNQNIPTGMYSLSVELKDQSTKTLRFAHTEAFLNGTNKYLTINTGSCVLKVNGASFIPSQGALVKPNLSPTAECSVTNPGKEAITVRAKVDYSDWFVVGFQKDVHEYSPKETITFNPGQTKVVSTVLPAISQPQVYDGLLYFIDSNSLPISTMTGFRWTIEGASARVDYVTLDKDNYSKGASAQVEVKAFASMDLFWRENSSRGQGYSPNAGTDLKNPKLIVKISSEGSVCGENQVDLPKVNNTGAWPIQKLAVPISQNCPNPKVEAEIKDGDQILVKSAKDYKSPPSGIAATLNLKNQNYLYYIAGGVIIIILLGVGFVIYRRRKKPPTATPSSPITPQSITTTAILIGVVGLSAFALKQFNILQKLSDDMTVLAQFSGKTHRVEAQYSSTLTDSVGQPIGGSIDFWAIISDFTQNGGASQFSIPIDCSQPPKITVYGKTDAGFLCANAPSHIIYKYFLDSQPINIASATSPDSSLASFGNNLQVRAPSWNAYGPRTSIVNFSGGQLAYGYHTFTAEFYVQGGFDQSSKSDFKQMTVGFTCQQPCPAGQTNPHGTCDGKSCTQVNSCGVTTCGTNVDCGGCLPGEQQPHLTCVNQSCKQVDACGTNTCANDQDCCPAGQITPHLACVNQSCQPVNTCGSSTCATNTDCCPAGQTSPHQECAGTNCTTVDSCGPPIVCTVPGETAPHGVCDGVSCKQVNTCGVTSCKEDKECYNDDMCKCDGFNAINLKNPSSSQFEFEAFAKVENSDVSKAKVDGIQFRMMKSSKSNPDSGTIIATSDFIKPEIVSSTGNKVRFRSAWKVNPPAYDPNATYRVFSKIQCAPKAASSSASLNQALALAKGQLYSSETNRVLGESADYSSEKLMQNNNYLELDTLNDAYFTKITETDACSAIRFEYGKY